MTGSSKSAVTTTNPFVGPRPIDTGQKIFGRDREIEELYYLLSAERIVLLHSPSGAGKSSLIQAGLLPRLERLFDVWGPTRVNLQPPEGDLGGGNRYARSANLGFEAQIPKERQRLPEQISAMTLSEYVAGRPRRRSAPLNRVLIFDQFEEILTVDPLELEAKRELFDQLGTLLQDPHVWALFALREDYLAPLDPYVELVPTHMRTRFRLDLLGREAARETISQSVEAGGRKFAPEAVGKLVNDLATMQVQRPDGTFETQTGPYVEPLHLQVACRGLWERMPNDRLTIDMDDIQSFGDVTKALAEYYEKEVAGIAGSDAGQERAIREWVGQKLITPEGIRGQVMKGAGASEGLDNTLILRLVDTHLVRGEQRAGATWYELSHDRLIEPVRASNSRWFEANLSAIQREAALWDKQSRPNGLLLRGPALIEAEGWASEHVSELTPVERDFLQACREARKQTKRMRTLRASLIVFSIVALVAAGLALLFVRKADKAKAEAERAEIVANGVVLPIYAVRDMAHAPKRSLLMGMEYTAVLRERREPDAEAGSSVMFDALLRGLSDGKSMGWPTVVAARTAISRDGQKVAAAGVNGSIEIRDVANPNAQAVMLPRQGNSAITAMSFSDDARWLASGAEDNWVYLWDLRNPQAKPQRFPGQTRYSGNLAFTPDGHWLAIASDEGVNGTVQKEGTKSTIQMWDLTVTPASKGPSDDVKGWIQALAFSPDGGKLAFAIDNYAWICDVTREMSATNGPCLLNTVIRINQSTPQRIAAITFSPDGRWLAFGGGLIVVLYDRGKNNSQVIRGPTGNVLSLAFGEDSAWLAISGKDQIVRLWNLEKKTPIFSAVLAGHESPVSSLAFYRHAESQELISASENDGVMRWAIPSRPLEPRTLETAGHKPWVVTFSHNETWLATGGTEGGVRLWNLAKSLSENIPLEQSGPGITAMEFSPDSRWLVAASRDSGTAKVWDMSKLGGQPFPLEHQKVLAIAFSPDGRRMATSSLEGVKLWTVDDAKPFTKYISLPRSSSSLESFGFSGDGKWLATANGTSVEAWDLRSVDPSGSRRFSIAPCEASVSGVAISPDGHLLAATCGSYAHVWNISKPDLPVSVMNQSFDDSAFSPIFSKDGRWFAARSWDGAVVLLQTQPSGGKPIQLQIADRQKVTDIRFTPDGHHLITASNDHIIRRWYLEDLETPGVLAGFDGQIQDAAFSEDGRWYVTVSDDSILRVWRMNVDELIKMACGFAGRNLSPAEWDQMPTVKPYHQTCPEFPPGVDLDPNKISAPPLVPGGFVAIRKTTLRDDSKPAKP